VRAWRNVSNDAAFTVIEGAMADIRGLLLLAVLILAGLGVSELLGNVLEQRAVFQTEASP
jgi:hypothetical protein